VVTPFADVFSAWAAGQPAVKAAVLIGSHIRPAGAPNAADPASDWDFQVVTSAPRVFSEAGWARALPGVDLRVYALRPAFGGVQKVTALFAGAETDFVVIPAGQLRLARLAMSLGLHRRPGAVRRALADLAVVIRPGYRFLKGAEGWGAFYERVLREVPDPRLDDAEAVRLADGFVCDTIWTLRKLARGELLAAQRMLHQSLAETKYRLLHELRLRRAQASYPEARRLERVASSEERASVSLEARLVAEDLHAAANKARATLEVLMTQLVPTWRWPEV
jgi:hypothetical protein